MIKFFKMLSYAKKNAIIPPLLNDERSSEVTRSHSLNIKLHQRFCSRIPDLPSLSHSLFPLCPREWEYFLSLPLLRAVLNKWKLWFSALQVWWVRRIFDKFPLWINGKFCRESSLNFPWILISIHLAGFKWTVENSSWIQNEELVTVRRESVKSGNSNGQRIFLSWMNGEKQHGLEWELLFPNGRNPFRSFWFWFWTGWLWCLLNHWLNGAH